MTEILVLLCLTVAALELYVALSRGRRRSDQDPGPVTRDTGPVAEDSSRILELDGRIRELEAAVTALRDQVHDLTDRLEHDLAPVVGRIHARVQDELDGEVTETLGGLEEYDGTLAGALAGDTAALEGPFQELLMSFGLRVRLQVDEPDGIRYYLACPESRGPVELEWDFIAMLGTLNDPVMGVSPERAAFDQVLRVAGETEKGLVRVGPLVVVRTPDALVAGVLSVSESREAPSGAMLGDLATTAAALHTLPENRFQDLTAWRRAA